MTCAVTATMGTCAIGPAKARIARVAATPFILFWIINKFVPSLGRDTGT